MAWLRWLLMPVMLGLLFGFPCKPVIRNGGDWTLCTRGGITNLIVWSDYYNYGAMWLRETDTGWKEGKGGTRVRTFAVTWWLRFEWKKR
jgi:hypothetical protein